MDKLSLLSKRIFLSFFFLFAFCFGEKFLEENDIAKELFFDKKEWFDPINLSKRPIQQQLSHYYSKESFDLDSLQEQHRLYQRDVLSQDSVMAAQQIIGKLLSQEKSVDDIDKPLLELNNPKFLRFYKNLKSSYVDTLTKTLLSEQMRLMTESTKNLDEFEEKIKKMIVEYNRLQKDASAVDIPLDPTRLETWVAEWYKKKAAQLERSIVYEAISPILDLFFEAQKDFIRSYINCAKIQQALVKSYPLLLNQNPAEQSWSWSIYSIGDMLNKFYYLTDSFSKKIAVNSELFINRSWLRKGMEWFFKKSSDEDTNQKYFFDKQLFLFMLNEKVTACKKAFVQKEQALEHVNFIKSKLNEFIDLLRGINLYLVIKDRDQSFFGEAIISAALIFIELIELDNQLCSARLKKASLENDYELFRTDLDLISVPNKSVHKGWSNLNNLFVQIMFRQKIFKGVSLTVDQYLEKLQKDISGSDYNLQALLESFEKKEKTLTLKLKELQHLKLRNFCVQIAKVEKIRNQNGSGSEEIEKLQNDIEKEQQRLSQKPSLKELKGIQGVLDKNNPADKKNYDDTEKKIKEVIASEMKIDDMKAKLLKIQDQISSFKKSEALLKKIKQDGTKIKEFIVANDDLNGEVYLGPLPENEVDLSTKAARDLKLGLNYLLGKAWQHKPYLLGPLIAFSFLTSTPSVNFLGSGKISLLLALLSGGFAPTLLKNHPYAAALGGLGGFLFSAAGLGSPLLAMPTYGGIRTSLFGGAVGFALAKSLEKTLPKSKVMKYGISPVAGVGLGSALAGGLSYFTGMPLLDTAAISVLKSISSKYSLGLGLGVGAGYGTHLASKLLPRKLSLKKGLVFGGALGLLLPLMFKIPNLPMPVSLLFLGNQWFIPSFISLPNLINSDVATMAVGGAALSGALELQKTLPTFGHRPSQAELDRRKLERDLQQDVLNKKRVYEQRIKTFTESSAWKLFNDDKSLDTAFEEWKKGNLPVETSFNVYTNFIDKLESKKKDLLKRLINNDQSINSKLALIKVEMKELNKAYKEMVEAENKLKNQKLLELLGN